MNAFHSILTHAQLSAQFFPCKTIHTIRWQMIIRSLRSNFRSVQPCAHMLHAWGLERNKRILDWPHHPVTQLAAGIKWKKDMEHVGIEAPSRTQPCACLSHTWNMSYMLNEYFCLMFHTHVVFKMQMRLTVKRNMHMLGMTRRLQQSIFGKKI